MQNSVMSFWKWFEKANFAYLFLNEVEPGVKEQLMNNLLEELHKYCDKLFFEIGDLPNDKHELIITAEGNKEYFAQVEALIQAAPRLDKWAFVPFIPPRDIHFKMNYEGLKLVPEDMWFMTLEHTDNTAAIGICICLGDYDMVHDHPFFESAMYKIIDVLLGERSAALDLEYVTFDQLPEDPQKEGLLALTELADYIYWKKNEED